MAAYLTRKGLKFKVATAQELAVRVCPLCSKPHNNKADNLYKLYVSRATGQYYCHRCGSNGSWFDLKAHLGDITPAAPLATGSTSAPSMADVSGVADTAPDVVPLDLGEVLSANRALFESSGVPTVLKYCTGQRGLSPEVLQEYLVGAVSRPFRDDSGAWVHEPCVTFPWVRAPAPGDDAAGSDCDAGGGADGDADAVHTALRMKIRSVVEKAHQATHPRGGAWGMFGMHTVPPEATEVVITEGEFDAMSVRQATGAYAVSLPNGARSLPVQLLPWLERFQRIVLWLDDDATGREGCEKLVSKLGVGRCHVVRPTRELYSGKEPAKDANEALLHGFDLNAMLASASPPGHEQIVTFEDLKSEVYQELTDPTLVAGTPYRWLPALQDITKGHRLGELTILTGATGAGKTTLLSQLSLDLCEQGIPTLWGSFEIKNVRLLKTMMSQLHGGSLAGVDRDTFDAVGDRFMELPMFFLKFFGSTDVDRVLDAMEYAVYVNDVEHIILDNLQFMMGSAGGRGFDRFDNQEKALDKFRQFASNQNVHVTLVVHPRKEPEHQTLGISSVFGTAKATQEADNVMILQATEKGKYLDVKKNRFDGTLGRVGVAYNPDSRLFEEVELPAALASPAGQGMGSSGGGAPPRVALPSTAAGAGTTTSRTTVATVNGGGVSALSPQLRGAAPTITFAPPEQRPQRSPARAAPRAAVNGGGGAVAGASATASSVDWSAELDSHLLSATTTDSPNGVDGQAPPDLPLEAPEVVVKAVAAADQEDIGSWEEGIIME